MLSTIPLWTNLPSLPCDIWNEKILGRIGSYIGDPICTNALTSTKKRISYDRVLVELNLVNKLVKEVIIDMPNDKVIHQIVVYEKLPRFASIVKLLGTQKRNASILFVDPSFNPTKR